MEYWSMPFEEEDGVSHGIYLIVYDRVDDMKKYLEVLKHWKFDKNHMLRVYPCKEESDIEVEKIKIYNLHDSINNSRVDF